jgi:ribose transport system substrate-binding protein
MHPTKIDVRFRARTLGLVLLLPVLFVSANGFSNAQEGGQGLTTPRVFPPFRPAESACAAPPGLRKVLAFAQDNERQFMQGVARGLSLAATQRGLEFRVALAANDPQKMIDQVQRLREEGVGAVVVAPVHPPSLARSLQQLIWAGAYVGAVVPPPAVSILNAPQYLTGKVLAESAAAYIRDNLQGKANVVILTHDSLQFLSPRFAAMRDTLQDMSGVAIVADISPPTVNEEGGFATMRTILLAHPDIDVVLGADTVVLGAL